MQQQRKVRLGIGADVRRARLGVGALQAKRARGNRQIAYPSL
jgi:hypothetical protein